MFRNVKDTTLAIMLSAAVPLRIADYQARGGPTDTDRVRSREFADTLGEQGDALQCGGKRGQAARLFGQLTDALAVMAHCPGGVRFAGERYEAALGWPYVRPAHEEEVKSDG